MDTLVVGSNGYFSKESLETAFGTDNIILCGPKLESRKEGNIRWFKKSIMGDDFKTLFFRLRWTIPLIMVLNII